MRVIEMAVGVDEPGSSRKSLRKTVCVPLNILQVMPPADGGDSIPETRTAPSRITGLVMA